MAADDRECLRDVLQFQPAMQIVLLSDVIYLHITFNVNFEFMNNNERTFKPLNGPLF